MNVAVGPRAGKNDVFSVIYIVFNTPRRGILCYDTARNIFKSGNAPRNDLRSKLKIFVNYVNRRGFAIYFFSSFRYSGVLCIIHL